MKELKSEHEYFHRGTDIWTNDRQWWVGLKRRLYAINRMYPDGLVRFAVRSQAEASPALSVGTPQEAGMKESVEQAIDAILKSLLNDDPDLGFEALIARDGIIFFREAYGSHRWQIRKDWTEVPLGITLEDIRCAHDGNACQSRHN